MKNDEDWKKSEWFVEWLELARIGMSYEKPRGYWEWIAIENCWKYR